MGLFNHKERRLIQRLIIDRSQSVTGTQPRAGKLMFTLGIHISQFYIQGTVPAETLGILGMN